LAAVYSGSPQPEETAVAERIQAASADEIFSFIDKELGRALPGG
jgi:hypothetical protein